MATQQELPVLEEQKSKRGFKSSLKNTFKKMASPKSARATDGASQGPFSSLKQADAGNTTPTKAGQEKSAALPGKETVAVKVEADAAQAGDRDDSAHFKLNNPAPPTQNSPAEQPLASPAKQAVLAKPPSAEALDAVDGLPTATPVASAADVVQALVSDKAPAAPTDTRPAALAPAAPEAVPEGKPVQASSTGEVQASANKGAAEVSTGSRASAALGINAEASAQAISKASDVAARKTPLPIVDNQANEPHGPTASQLLAVAPPVAERPTHKGSNVIPDAPSKDTKPALVKAAPEPVPATTGEAVPRASELSKKGGPPIAKALVAVLVAAGGYAAYVALGAHKEEVVAQKAEARGRAKKRFGLF